MKKNQLILSILLVGIAFGTAWAIRGQFGHEPGAAFAGIIGGSALLLAAKRKDWYHKMLPIIAASAIGWGTTGMIRPMPVTSISKVIKIKLIAAERFEAMIQI